MDPIAAEAAKPDDACDVRFATPVGPFCFRWGPLRVSELLLLAYFSLVPIRALAAHLPVRQSLLLFALNGVALGAIYGVATQAARVEGGLAERRSARWMLVRNTLPAVLVLLAYRESGLFYFPDPVHRLDHIFEHWDELFLNHPVTVRLRVLLSPWWQYYLEGCYLLCYPLVLLGLMTFLVRRSSEGSSGSQAAGLCIDHFWTTVLTALLSCYTVYPWFPLTPPRLFFHDVPAESSPLLRHLNIWLLDQYGVQACLFPSGHVAAAMATALAVGTHHARWGPIFLLLAVSIAAATVFLRYHYAADALAGALVAGLASWISKRIHHTR